MLAAAEGITVKAAEVAVNTTFKSMETTLSNSHRIEIRGFGSFKVKDGYHGPQSKTAEKILVKPKKLPFFKLGKELCVARD